MKIKNLLAFMILPGALIVLVLLVDLSAGTASTLGGAIAQDIEAICVVSLVSIAGSAYLLPALLKQKRERAKNATLVPALALWACILTLLVASIGACTSLYTLIQYR